jgi:hypothetical protein
MEFTMNKNSYLLLIVATTTLSLTAMADWPPPPSSQTTTAQATVTTVQSGPVQPVAGVPFFDAGALQGQWVSKCVPATPGWWILPTQQVTSEYNSQQITYTFNGSSLSYIVQEFTNPECIPAGIGGGILQSKSGGWTDLGIDPIDPTLGAIGLLYTSCYGTACALNDPQSFYNVPIFLARMRANRLDLGVRRREGDVHFFFKQPLFRAGTQLPGTY